MAALRKTARKTRKGGVKKKAKKKVVSPSKVVPPLKEWPPDPVRVRTIVGRLEKNYDAVCALDHTNAWQLLQATILSAQCTDERVNMVTPQLFSRWPTPADLANAEPENVQEVVRTTGFFRNKARNLIGAATTLEEDFGGEVPQSMKELITLPGVARKTANVVLWTAFGKNEGFVVDTHIHRLAKRLGFTREDKPPKIEQDLMALVPREKWGSTAHRLIWHGRKICSARKPNCDECPLQDRCASAFLV